MNLPGSPGTNGRDAHPAPSMWIGSLFSAVLGNLLPGPGTLYESQTLRFFGRAHVGDDADGQRARDREAAAADRGAGHPRAPAATT